MAKKEMFKIVVFTVEMGMAAKDFLKAFEQVEIWKISSGQELARHLAITNDVKGGNCQFEDLV